MAGSILSYDKKIDDRLFSAHAFLIEGPSGEDNFLAAKELSCSLLCKNNPSCGVCSDCKKILSDIHPDVTVLDAGDKKSISVESVRAFKEDINFLPNEAKFRIYIISSAENMTFQAQNSLLKMLEEPPPYVKFILTSRDKNSLLQTVLSRVLSLKLPPMQSDALVDKLKKEFPQKTSEEIMSIARLSGGYYKKATAIAKDDFLFQDKDAFLTLLNYKGQKNREGFFKLGEKLLADRKKDLDCLIDNFLILLRDVAVVKKARESYNETYFCADSLKIEEISSKITDRKIQSLTNLAYEAKGMISMNGNFTLLSWFFLSGIWEEIN